MGPKFAMDMTRERSFPLSLSKKRKKKIIPERGRFDPSIVFFGGLGIYSMRLTLHICRAEDLVLAEERTTEADRELIMEGIVYNQTSNVMCLLHFTHFDFPGLSWSGTVP